MSQGGPGKTLFRGASALIAAAAFIYALLRAARLSFSFDESATYISYVSSSVLSAFSFRDANNHILYVGCRGQPGCDVQPGQTRHVPCLGEGATGLDANEF